MAINHRQKNEGFIELTLMCQFATLTATILIYCKNEEKYRLLYLATHCPCLRLADKDNVIA